MPARDEKKVKLARAVSQEKKDKSPEHHSPEAAGLENNMGQDELRKMATKPGSSSSRRSATPK
jgi:hypothetical protein